VILMRHANTLLFLPCIEPPPPCKGKPAMRVHLLGRTLPCWLLLTFALLIQSAPSVASGKESGEKPPEPPEITWKNWNSDLFTEAKAGNRYVLLDLYAKWCHWCHFMEERTYAHPVIRGLVQKHYIAVKADQDANPDLASRYGDWGWPATIVFDPDGNEVAKFQGFLRPSAMAQILDTVANHPDQVPQLKPEPAIARSTSVYLSKAQRQQMLKLMDETYDAEHAGWGRRLKFLQPDVLEFALGQAERGDKRTAKKLEATLDAALALMDPVWGGVYQYSHKRDWSAPHFEKIIWSQSQTIRIYTRAHALFGKAEYLDAAQRVYTYLITHLQSPEGAFYASQDADIDAKLLGIDFYGLNAQERIELGRMPPIDKSLYARENGWAISGLLTLYKATDDKAVLGSAIKAAEWIVEHRMMPDGGFRHGENDRGGPYLSDSLDMARAMLDLYMATGEGRWLLLSAQTGDFISRNFKHDTAGFVTTKAPIAKSGAFLKPYLNIEENSRLARYANLLHRTLGKKRFHDMADHAMRYLTSEAITSRRRFLLGVVLADEEIAIEPAHIMVVGAKSDERAKQLHTAALKLPLAYRRIDWWDPAKGPMLNADIEYPPLDEPAAFACANQICSLPVSDPAKLAGTVRKIMRQRVSQRPSQ